MSASSFSGMQAEIEWLTEEGAKKKKASKWILSQMGFSLHESFTKNVIGILVEDQRGKSKTKSCKNILKRKTQSSQVQIMFL